MGIYRKIVPTCDKNTISSLLCMTNTPKTLGNVPNGIKLKVKKVQVFGLRQFLVIIISPDGIGLKENRDLILPLLFFIIRETSK